MKFLIYLGLCVVAVTALAQEKPPVTVRLEPPGIQKGVSSVVTVHGSNLVSVSQGVLDLPGATVEVVGEKKAEAIQLKITPPAGTARGSYNLAVSNSVGLSTKILLHVDDLPHRNEGDSSSAQGPTSLPLISWGIVNQPGDTDDLSFQAVAGQTVVFDLSARSLGSKLEARLTLMEEQGRVLASSANFDNDPDPLLVHTFQTTGNFRVAVSDQKLTGSVEHRYRLVMGSFPFVTAVHPIGVVDSAITPLELVGYNLPIQAGFVLGGAGSTGVNQLIPKGHRGDLEVALDPSLYRMRRLPKVWVGEGVETVESEPNDSLSQAQKISIPGAVSGRFSVPIATTPEAPSKKRKSKRGGESATSVPSTFPDVDLFSFEAEAGEEWIFETAAARRGSPVDTKLEILDEAGNPVPRVLLQALRNSAVTFRGVDSVTTDTRVENWEEMELNEYLYLEGEVVRLFRAPQGPDSGFAFYASNGKRKNYFDTTATAHAVDSICYTVMPHPVGTTLVPNGLPTFLISYQNDDDADRKLGTDSKLHFRAPKQGRYVVRVSDTRGFYGSRNLYRLTARKPAPDFNVTLTAAPSVPAGSGQAFTLTADRADGFEGEISVEIAGLPPGFVAPGRMVIESGHFVASGTVWAAADAPAPTAENRSKSVLKAVAMVNGRRVEKPVNSFSPFALAEKPKVFVDLEPDPSANASAQNQGEGVPIIEIRPGQVVPAQLKVRRNGFDEILTFTVENLPHGIIVDNIGLNGVLIPKGQNERQIFFAASKWVQPMDRLCYAIENQAGRQTSRTVLIRVR